MLVVCSRPFYRLQLFLFSDGYADQFGGEKGKKLKVANFRALLASLQHLPIREQETKIRSAFEAWKGHYDQVDDVCVMGVKL